MRVVDSSAWIEWLTDSTLGRRLAKQFPEKSDWIVPTVIQFEIYRWLARNISEEDAQQFISFTQECVIVELETSIAVLAADLAISHQLSAMDAMIYATALSMEADLLTCDAHFKDLTHVTYVPKSS